MPEKQLINSCHAAYMNYRYHAEVPVVIRSIIARHTISQGGHYGKTLF